MGVAKELYVEQASVIMQLVRETEDDKVFQAALKSQLKQVIQKAEGIKLEIEEMQAMPKLQMNKSYSNNSG